MRVSSPVTLDVPDDLPHVRMVILCQFILIFTQNLDDVPATLVPNLQRQACFCLFATLSLLLLPQQERPTVT